MEIHASDYLTKGTYLKDVLDPGFREQMQEAPNEALTSWGIDLPPDVDVSVHVNTDDTFHLVLPPDPNIPLSDETLGMVAGGKTASTIGSGGSASTAASIPSTASTASSASSAASIACAS